MKNKKLIRILVILMLMCMTATSCKKKEGTGHVVIPNATSAPSMSDSVSRGQSGELKMPIPENADRDNPYSVNTEELHTMFALIFEPLISVDNTGKLVPALAQSWTRSETSDNVWTLSLRTNVKWHDGTDFSAGDVTFSFNTLKAYLMSEGASSYYANVVSKVESMTKVDDNTVTVSMSTAGYHALYALSFPVVCASTWANNPVNGTGAYKVTSTKSTSTTLSVNKDWWKELPHIKTIRFEERLNNETALASYEAGQLNFVPTSSLSAGKYRREGVTKVLDIMTQDVELLMFNYSNNLLYDMNIRKAIAYAIDRSKLITNIYMNRAQSCDVPVAPDSWLYSTKSKSIELDMEYACMLLENAGYTDSNDDGIREKDGNAAQKLSFRLLVSQNTDSTTRKNAAEAIAAQLLECGIELVVESKNYLLTDPESEYMTALNAGDFDLALVGVNLSQCAELNEFFKQDGVLNFGGVSDEELLAMTNNILTAKDETNMRERAYEFETAFVEKLPFLVLYFRLNSIVYTNDLQVPDPVREPNIMYHEDAWYMGSD